MNPMNDSADEENQKAPWMDIAGIDINSVDLVKPPSKEEGEKALMDITDANANLCALLSGFMMIVTASIIPTLEGSSSSASQQG